MRALALSAVVLVLISGCKGSSNEKIKEYTDIQSKVSSENEVKAENDNRARWSSAMETDLQRRQRFYQAMVGTYEGELKIGEEAFNIRITMVSSIPPYVPSDRVRLPEEVASDLNNLYLNIQVVQWNPRSKYGSVGCLVENVRPDINRGRLSVSSEACPNLYLFRISEEAGVFDVIADQSSAKLASAVVEGQVGSVDRLIGRMQPTTNSAVYEFTAMKVRE